MKLKSLITELELPQAAEAAQDRRAALQWLGKSGARAVLATLPLGVGSTLTAQAAPAQSLSEALQLALKLARLQYEFYTNALQATNLTFPTPLVRAALQDIRQHEEAHLNRLLDALTGLGEAPEPKPDFDFSLANQFPDVFTSYAGFLAVAQVLKDGTVRALKAGLINFFDTKTLLKLMLAMHSTQARHAGYIRNLRRLSGQPAVTPWVTAAEPDNTVAAVYASEANTQQQGTDVAALPAGTATIGQATATQAFDEPFSATEIQDFLTLVTL